MTEISIFAIDIAKSVLQVVKADGCGRPVMNRPLRRSQVLGFFAKQKPAVVGLDGRVWESVPNAMGRRDNR